MGASEKHDAAWHGTERIRHRITCEADYLGVGCICWWEPDPEDDDR